MFIFAVNCLETLFLIVAALQWFWVSPAPPVLWGVWREIALSQRGRCSPLLGWSCPLSALQCGNILDCSDWPCRCVEKQMQYLSHELQSPQHAFIFSPVNRHSVEIVHTQSGTSGLGRWPHWFSQGRPSIHASHSNLWSSALLWSPEGQFPL